MPPELDELAIRIKVSRAKAFNYLRTFATSYYAAKDKYDPVVGGESFAWWLLRNTGLLTDRCEQLLNAFSKHLAAEHADRAKAASEEQRRQSRAAAAAEAERRAHEREQKQQAAEAARQTKEAEKQRRAEEAEKRRQDRAAEKQRRTEEAKQKARTAAAKQRRRRQKVKAGLKSTDQLTQLAAQIHVAQSTAEGGRQAWVNGVMGVAVALAMARSLLPSDIAFGAWFDTHAFDFNKNDRAALVGMGQNPDLARAVLRNTGRFSCQLIWREEILPQLPQAA